MIPAIFGISNKRKTSRSLSIAAPVGGWNDRDPIANMEIKYALIMKNWWPGTNDVSVRKGQTDHVTGIVGQVDSLMNYSAINGTTKLFGVASGSIYDVTTAGAVGAAAVTGLSNSRFQDENFTLSDGTSYLVTFNGADDPQYFDGTTWTSITGVSTPAITGVVPTTLIHVAAHKRRLWLTQVGSLRAWYLPVDSVGGAAANIDLAGIADKGGFLMAIGTWTLDAGSGVDDLWVGYTSEGQVIVYKGTNPTSATTWALVGVWNIGEPIGRRCLIKYSGDLLLISVDGVFPMSSALQSSQLDPRVALTDKIQNAVNTAAIANSGNFGWQLLFYPKASMLLLNVPIQETNDQEQYAMNTITKSWGRFTGVNASCWVIHNEEPYFGGTNVVGRFWNTFADNGTAIEADLKYAFSYFKARGRQKKWDTMRPIFLTNGAPSIRAGVNIDFGDSTISNTLTTLPVQGGVWDVAKWDEDNWGGALSVSDGWISVFGVGVSAAARIISESNGIEVRLQAIDFIYQYGGIIG